MLTTFRKRISIISFRIGLSLSLALLLSACPSIPPEVTPPPPTPKTPVFGLALGGGAARGFAHVGVLQVLEEAGIRPQLVAGTSAGSVVAALYASGKSVKDIEKLSQSMDENVITDWGIPFFSRGAVRGEALATYINKQVENKPIDKMPIPLGIVATDLQSGEGILFTRGNTGQAVRASSSVPAVFQPVKIGDREYVDGGLVAPVPVEYAKRMGATVILAVDISSPPETEAVDGMFSILMQTFNIMGKSINRLELKGADVVVRPNLNGIKSTDFNSKLKSMEAGRAAMRQALPQLRALLGK